MLPKNILKYICIQAISMLLMIPVEAFAQREKLPTAPQDSIPLFRGVAVSVDMLGLIQRQVSDYGQYEAALRVNLKDKYFPVLELGIGEADHTEEFTRIHYAAKSPYARAGMDFNLMRNKHDIYRLYGGARYAYSAFKYDLFSPGITDPNWGGTAEYKASNVKCYYHWLEFAFGLDAKITGALRMGWSLRYRRRLFHNEGPLGNAWYVPGYGVASNARIGGTFHVTIEF